jgi:hypothetical protein
VRDRLVPALAELLDHCVGDPDPFVGGNGDSHLRELRYTVAAQATEGN